MTGTEPVPGRAERRPYRPPIGIPARTSVGWRGTLVSIALHALVVLVALAPILIPSVAELVVDGAGGSGPAGGGGGGRRGDGAANERMQYVEVAPAPVPVSTAVVTPPVIPPPVVVPPVTPPPVAPPVAPAITPPAAVVPTPPATTATAGSGTGGTGTDGSSGSGSGSGGGVGSGIGTGRGSGEGPGTGGGAASVYPPRPLFMPLPPFPVPGRVRGTSLTIVFEIDSLGRVMGFDFPRTRDNGYNDRIRSTLKDVRFRPATRMDGTPVSAKYPITWSL